MISRTCLRPPASILAVRGLRVSTSSALSTFRRLGLGGKGGKPFRGLDLIDGLASGWSAFALLAVVEVFVDGISSDVSFPISFCRRKKGHNLMGQMHATA